MSTETGTGDAYLLYHSIGQYPGKHADMLAGLTDFTDAWAAPNGDQWADVLPKRQQFIDLWAELIGAPKGTVTTTESVTTGLMAVIGALPEGTLRGKKVLVAEDGFPSLHFLLTGLSKRFGFTLNTVPIRQGGHWVEAEDIIAHWDEEVALALLTWVSSTTSHRLDIPQLVAHGRKMGSLIGVDMTQAVGLLKSGEATPLDFVDAAIAEIGPKQLGLADDPGVHLGEKRPGQVVLWRTVGDPGGEDEDVPGNWLLSRAEMRATPPHILITNYAMLEHILLLPTNRQLLAGADLRWIVLDEIHTYAGAQAIEVAFLLRRLKAHLGIPDERVRCVGTSASLDPGRKAELAGFASRLFGEPFAGEAAVITSQRKAHPSLARRPSRSGLNAARWAQAGALAAAAGEAEQNGTPLTVEHWNFEADLLDLAGIFGVVPTHYSILKPEVLRPGDEVSKRIWSNSNHYNLLGLIYRRT